MKRLKWILFAIVVMTVTTGCRKDLCYNHEEHGSAVKVVAQADWELEWERNYGCNWKTEWSQLWETKYESLLPKAASGIRVINYVGDSFKESNISSAGGRIYPELGESSLLFYNNDTEYIVFSELNSVASATATTRSVTRGGFSAMHKGERTMNQPDMLFGHYIEEHSAEKTFEFVNLPITLRPLVYKYMVRYEFATGAEYIALARGAIAGMAESVYLKDGRTGEKAATILFDCMVTGYGAMSNVMAFGIPNFPDSHYSKAAGERNEIYSINLEVRMKNGKFKNFVVDITDQMRKQPRGGVIIVKDLEISKEEGTQGSGAFDPEVDGWGDFIDVPLPIG